MTIRIWHQSFTVLQDLGAYDAALRAHFKHVARPGTTVDMHGMRAGTYTSDYPGDDIKYAPMQYLHGTQFIAAAVRAEREGADAFAISTLPEPGLQEAKALLDIPVVGYAESAMFTACLLGQRFGVLVFIEELAELVAANAVRHGLATRFVGAEHAGFNFSDVLAGFDNPGPLIDRFKQSARRLIDKGADVIIPGEAPLNVLLAAHGVHEVDGAVVLDSLASWIKHAEMLVDLKRKCGITHSRRGYFNGRPSPERVEKVLDFYSIS